MQKDYKEGRFQIVEIGKWTNKELIAELRNPIRATLPPDAYHLLFAEALARLLK